MNSLINKLSITDGSNLTTTVVHGNHINALITGCTEDNLKLSREYAKMKNFSSLDLTSCIDVVKKANNIQNITPICIISTYSQSFNNPSKAFNVLQTPGVYIFI